MYGRLIGQSRVTQTRYVGMVLSTVQFHIAVAKAAIGYQVVIRNQTALAVTDMEVHYIEHNCVSFFCAFSLLFHLYL